MPTRRQPREPGELVLVADLVPVLPEATLACEYKAQDGGVPSESKANEIKPPVGLDHVRVELDAKNANNVLPD